MEYISIKNWEKYQHYRDRNPPWIKLYHALLDDYKYCCLQDASKLLLTSLFLLASRNENKIPADSTWIKMKSSIKGKIDFKPLLSAGFISLNNDASRSLANDKQNGVPETETETETETEKKTYGEFKNILLTDEELQKLKDRFTDSGAQERIESISSYVASKKKKYASHYATILTWERKRQEEGKSDDWKRRFLQSD